LLALEHLLRNLGRSLGSGALGTADYGTGQPFLPGFQKTPEQEFVADGVQSCLADCCRDGRPDTDFFFAPCGNLCLLSLYVTPKEGGKGSGGARS
jgi:hypothetical protein